jgi:hypothetical protein
MRLARFERRAAVAKSESGPPPTHPAVCGVPLSGVGPKTHEHGRKCKGADYGDGHERFGSTLELPLRGLAPATS